MYILETNSFKYYLGERLLFKLPALKLHTKSRIGLIGLNGSGKTTLAKISAKNDIHDKITDIEYFSDSNIVKIFGESEIAYYRQGEFQTYYEKENRPDTIKFLKNKQDNLYDKLKLNNEKLEKKISIFGSGVKIKKNIGIIFKFKNDCRF